MHLEIHEQAARYSVLVSRPGGTGTKKRRTGLLPLISFWMHRIFCHYRNLARPPNRIILVRMLTPVCVPIWSSVNWEIIELASFSIYE